MNLNPCIVLTLFASVFLVAPSAWPLESPSPLQESKSQRSDAAEAPRLDAPLLDDPAGASNTTTLEAPVEPSPSEQSPPSEAAVEPSEPTSIEALSGSDAAVVTGPSLQENTETPTIADETGSDSGPLAEFAEDAGPSSPSSPSTSLLNSPDASEIPSPPPGWVQENEGWQGAQGDEVWLISSRGLSTGSDLDQSSDGLKVWKRCNKCWQSASINEILDAPRPDAVTVVWCHGNRFSFSDSKSYGLAVYRALCQCGAKKRNLRFIIWSWPSDKVAGPLRDARIKGERALCEGRYVGWLLGRLPAGDTVGLVGYSFGARVAGEAARHYFNALPAYCASERSVRLVLFAPAVDQGWLFPGSRYGNMLKGLDRLAIFYNSRDIVLKRYRLLYRRGNDTPALGYRGAPASVRGMLGSALTQLDVTRWLRREHSLTSYLGEKHVLCETCNALFDPARRTTAVSP